MATERWRGARVMRARDLVIRLDPLRAARYRDAALARVARPPPVTRQAGHSPDTSSENRPWPYSDQEGRAIFAQWTLRAQIQQKRRPDYLDHIIRRGRPRPASGHSLTRWRPGAVKPSSSEIPISAHTGGLGTER